MKTHTGQHMHDTSNQPKTCKSRQYKNTSKRRNIVCSTEESLPDKLNYIKTQFS